MFEPLKRFQAAKSLGTLLFLAFALTWLAWVPAKAADNEEFLLGQATLLQPGDELSFQVFGQSEMNTVLQVGEDGAVTIPLAGSVPVRGLSVGDAAKALEKALRDGMYLIDPHVTLAFSQARNQRVSVLGEVRTPGRYNIDSRTTIFDLLAQAGGLSADGASTIYLIRQKEGGGVDRYSINLRGLSDGKFTLPVESLKGGDAVYVPKAPQYYIFGEVTRAGTYAIDPEMNVLQAIAKAGGVTPRGSMNRIEIKRRVGPTKYKNLSASLTDSVQADDVIQINESIF